MEREMEVRKRIECDTKVAFSFQINIQNDILKKSSVFVCSLKFLFSVSFTFLQFQVGISNTLPLTLQEQIQVYDQRVRERVILSWERTASAWRKEIKIQSHSNRYTKWVLEPLSFPSWNPQELRGKESEREIYSISNSNPSRHFVSWKSRDGNSKIAFWLIFLSSFTSIWLNRKGWERNESALISAHQEILCDLENESKTKGNTDWNEGGKIFLLWIKLQNPETEKVSQNQSNVWKYSRIES